MFEPPASGKFLTPGQYKSRARPLRRQLLQAQFDLATRDHAVIILVAGLPGAGKGVLVHRLNEWLDPRWIETSAIWRHSDEEEQRPFFWRFWRALPPRGRIGILLGSWYTRPLHRASEEQLSAGQMAAHCQEINAFEQMLHDDGTLIIKLWLQVGREAQRMQLNEEAPRLQQNPRVGAFAEHWWQLYPRAQAAAEQLMAATDRPGNRWHLVSAEDKRYREITAGEIILQALHRHAQTPTRRQREEAAPATADVAQCRPSALDQVRLERRLDKPSYKQQLYHYQRQLQDLSWLAHRQGRSLVAVFEGWDAAGKGSAIRRVTAAVDPRLYKVVQFAAPTDEERAHHYLWRFWRKLERDGRATLFDRSWYGRVLVERVEELTPVTAWQSAYREINQFESQLLDHGNILVKFWLHISPEEQLRRFEARQREPHKQYKITADDWRNRARWQDYADAVEEMVARTSTRAAPWTLVAGNDKRYARVQILRALCDALATGLGAEYPAPDAAAIMTGHTPDAKPE